MSPSSKRANARREGGVTLWRLLARDSRAGEARGALRAWDWWETWSESVWPIPQIPGARCGALRMRFVRYTGRSRRLADGVLIRRGDLIGELHLDNVLALRMAETSPWRFEQAAKEDLRALARWIEQTPSPARPIAFRGRTFLGRAARRSGFVCFPCRRTPYILLFRFYLQGLLVLYSREGWRRMRHTRARTAFPSDIWMSAAALLRNYGSSG
jgi:hypothetical protein